MILRALALLGALAGAAACDPSGPASTPPRDPCASSAITKGPWVMRATATAASLFWETRELGCIQAAVAPEDGSAPERIVDGTARSGTVRADYGVKEGLPDPDLAGTYYVSRVDVAGLAPGRCYAWRVRSLPSGTSDARGRFCTAAPSGQAFRVLAIGDTNPALGHTVPTLTHTLPERPDLVVHMGDIQYYASGIETWALWFRRMAPMLRAGAFFPAIGNHENELEGTEFADYVDRLFHEPAALASPADGTSAWYRFEWGGVWFHTVDTELPYDSASPQYAWLVASLAEVTKRPGFRFSVVYMHRNLYTLGDATPQVDRRAELQPLFVANKVRLVLSGHMHGYERFEVGDLTFVTTAGGGGLIGDVNANVAQYPADAPLRVKAAAAYHALLLDVTPMGATTRLRGRAIDEYGDTIDAFTHDIE